MQSPVNKSTHHTRQTIKYVVVGLLSLVLTAAAFYTITFRHPLPHEVFLIVVLAAIQVALQAILLMHLDTGRRLYSVIFGFGCFLAIIIAIGTSAVITSGTPSQLGARSLATGNLSTGELLSNGKQIVMSQCISCHTVNGSGGKIGPNLNDVMAGKVNLVPGGKPTDPTWLTHWVSDPQAVWSGAAMPNLGLSTVQVEAVVKYLGTLR